MTQGKKLVQFAQCFKVKKQVLSVTKYCEKGNTFTIRHSLRSKKKIKPCGDHVRPSVGDLASSMKSFVGFS